MARLSADALYASPLRPAMETAEIIADALALPIQSKPRPDGDRLRRLPDKRPCELAELYPQALAQWKSEDLDFVIPGGESRRQVIARGRAALLAIAAATRQAAILVAHGRLLTCTLKDILGIPASQPPFSLQNGSITKLSADASGRFELLPWIRSIICAAGSLRLGRFVMGKERTARDWVPLLACPAVRVGGTMADRKRHCWASQQ